MSSTLSGGGTTRIRASVTCTSDSCIVPPVQARAISATRLALNLRSASTYTAHLSFPPCLIGRAAERSKAKHICVFPAPAGPASSVMARAGSPPRIASSNGDSLVGKCPLASFLRKEAASEAAGATALATRQSARDASGTDARKASATSNRSVRIRSAAVRTPLAARRAASLVDAPSCAKDRVSAMAETIPTRQCATRPCSVGGNCHLEMEETREEIPIP
mmetsp:Transcript_5638/g.35011  ORF Transcript_5638/g.35011 Transcript_5638/m.35011 type:complete len:220 (+) Transcript_5638:516-1175(+)